MKNKLLHNLSANAVQLLVNQCCGLIIFYILSIQLAKDSFGKLNLVLAIMLMAFNLLTLGIEQVLIKKIAANQALKNILSLYILHVLLSGLFFYLILLLCNWLIVPAQQLYPLLLVIGAGKLMIYFSAPFKMMANGLERFKLLAYMLVISNVTRSLGLLILALFKTITLKETMIFFLAGDVIEFVLSLYLFKRNIKIPITLNKEKKLYVNLLRETLPQTGVVLITSLMSRLDWVFIGLMVSTIKLAEYSFAYKIFEIATLPLLAIAPLLLPRLTKIFSNISPQTNHFKSIVNIELMIAMVSILVLNILWVPVIDFISAGKYGSINVNTIFLLSLCIPFLYVNNLMWTIYFAQGLMKMILHGFILTFSVNLVFNILLIPFFGNEGAAISFLLATIAQTVFYLIKNQLPILQNTWKNICIYLTCTLVSGFLAKHFLQNEALVLTVALLLFAVFLVLTGRLKWSDRKTFPLLFQHWNN